MTTHRPVPVQIYAMDDTLVTTNTFQLLQWKHALALEIKTGMSMSGGRKVSTHLRKLLKTPRNFKKEYLLEFISDCLDNVMEQMSAA